MDGQAKCQRCGKHFDRTDLRQPSLILRLIAAPALFFFVIHSGLVGGEVMALYCRPCRRQLNFIFFFLAFCVVLGVIAWAVEKLKLLD
jgi:hypothetical protein